MRFGFVFGSAGSRTLARIWTWIGVLLLPGFAGRIGGGFPPLIQTLGVTAVLAVVAAVAFVGELQARRWRRLAQAILALMLLLIGWWVWPEPKA